MNMTMTMMLLIVVGLGCAIFALTGLRHGRKGILVPALIGLVLNGLLIVDQEFIIPGIIPKLTRKHDQLHTGAGRTFAIHAMQDDPAVQKSLADGGLEALKESPEQFGAMNRAEFERYGKLVRDANIKVEGQ